MKFKIDELEVIFPYQFVYNEQFEYMKALKRTLDEKGHGILEMPTGTGKTVSLLALIIAYLAQKPDHVKRLIYCTRTVVEMEKTLKEIQFVLKARQAEGGNVDFKAVGLTSRRNLCIHPSILGLKDKEKVDSACRKMTAEWVRGSSQATETCQYYETFVKSADAIVESLPYGVYSIEDLKLKGVESTVCPYFLARSIVSKANIVVYNYLYLIDPNVSSVLQKEHKKESVIVFDEAHNIDDVCIEAYTVRLNQVALQEAYNNVQQVKSKLSEANAEVQQRLSDEYSKMIQNLEQKPPEGGLQQEVKNVVSGQIRQASRFVKFMERVVLGLKQSLKDNSNALRNSYAVIVSTQSFGEGLMKAFELEKEALKGCGERFMQLMNTMQIAEIDRFVPLTKVTQFVGLLVSHNEGFKVVFQANSFEDSVNDKYVTLACFDSSLAMKPIFTMFQSVILTSGTMSPIDIYPRILDFKPVLAQSIDIELSRNSIQPLIVTMAEDGTELTSEFTERNNEDVSRNYGNFLLELSENVPDGMIVFMPSYNRMEEWARAWEKDNFLEQISKNKMLFIETKDVNETFVKLAQFRKACDAGRGAALFSIARGKIAEGIDFEQHYGRCVAVLGFPALNSKDTLILERCRFLEEKFKITKNDFIEFDAMRQSSQCLGRVMRSKTDYGVMIMCDKRFSQTAKLEKMPRWIRKNLESECRNMSSEQAITYVRNFFRKMAQPFQINEGTYIVQKE